MAMTGYSHANRTLEAEALARTFHERYEELAPAFGYKTRDASAVPWDDVPHENKLLMIETAKAVIDAGWQRPRRT